MKAKNTVDFNYLDGIYEGWLKTGGTAGDLQLMTAQLQAEISFMAGIREVLEFIPLQEYLKQSELIEDVPIWIGINWKEAHAKLKEWGLKELK